jgi:exonuclease III
MCDEKKLERRRADDEATYEYISQYATMLSKPIIYLCDLNVCHMNNDMSASADFLFEEGLFQRSSEKIPKAEKDQGFCGTTVNERTRFEEMLRASHMYDPGAVILNEPNEALTSRGIGRYYGEGLRLDYMLISETLAESGCIKKYRITGHGHKRIGFFGSDHCPVILELVQDWKHRLKDKQYNVVDIVRPMHICKTRNKQNKIISSTYQADQ